MGVVCVLYVCVVCVVRVLCVLRLCALVRVGVLCESVACVLRVRCMRVWRVLVCVWCMECWCVCVDVCVGVCCVLECVVCGVCAVRCVRSVCCVLWCVLFVVLVHYVSAPGENLAGGGGSWRPLGSPWRCVCVDESVACCVSCVLCRSLYVACFVLCV